MKKAKPSEIKSDRCKTRYPLVFVHGLAFRDGKPPQKTDRKLDCDKGDSVARKGQLSASRAYSDVSDRAESCHLRDNQASLAQSGRYWGRIPRVLQENGAKVFFGNTEAYASVGTNAAILVDSIEKVLAETGAEKANIIAHSKGGIDARYAISSLGLAEKTASLSTIATPHRGSKSLDFFCKFPKFLRKIICFFKNIRYRLAGDKKPDVYKVTQELSTKGMLPFNQENPDAEDVYYQSFTSLMKHAGSDVFLCVPYCIIKIIEGENDGMVTPSSAEWANYRGIVDSPTKRGISHDNMVDRRRRRLTKKTAEGKYSDITDFYVEMIEGLKARGL